ncbi:transglycosylase domain-containing protein [Mycolicibacter sp. MYC123]|uniref:Transglycosylase domain-containing protein n=1 Tax=[Mycobacterium] zoologicum TaxID=2872311 RepID=A0ABU5YIE2_9MYCO|nr:MULTISPECIES: transglycosylase domain-containing protein [unclassified Mycolicibacter]MEB3049817.1 transglycosylase domain-containing protein [Mycolicibacter sp. MYC123]MEB3064092.1 transglycosylase domain-containing protein [Mycolicibacter sp. MYC101]
MCWASRSRPRGLGAAARHAVEPAPPVSRHSDDPPEGAPVGPDDRHTTIIPAVDDNVTVDLRDPIDAVRAALDGSAPEREPALSGRIPRREPPAKDPQKPKQERERPAAPHPLDRLRGLGINWKWIRRGCYAAFAFMLLLPVITFAMAYSITDVPSPGDIRTNQVSTIFAKDGTELAKIVPPEGNRVDININQVPVYVRNAVLAAEDRDFYSNPGFSVSGFARAIKNNIFGGDTQGGSTITQQYVKNALVGDARAGLGGLVRKAKELVIATKMSSEWPKDDVLQAYLNIIYFGRGSYGIAAASRAYFDKPVEQLDVAEGALLAALIQRPSTLDPAVDPEGAVERWNWVLDGMVETGALSAEERAGQDFPITVSPDLAKSQNVTTGPNGLIQRQVTKELLELFNIDEETLNTQGLQITATIDPEAQDAAEDAVDTYLKDQIPNMRTAVVSIDPRSGAVRAYYGGADANGFDFAQAGLQTGSSFKVFALVAALEQGIGLGYQIDSSPLTVENGRIKITNAEGESCGTCNIAEALKRSLNTAYYRLMLKLKNGAQDVADAAHAAGVAKSFPGVPHTLSQDGGPPEGGVVLGQYQTRVIDMASAYATLADSGVFHPPHFVQKVVNAHGEVLFDADTAEDTGEQRIPKAVADNVTAAMAPIAGWSRGHNLAGGRPSASKTGTTQLGDTGANRDGWMVGYTPSLSTAVWVGTTGGDEPLVNQWGGPVYGASIPADIWKATMDGALQGTTNESFPTPTEIGGYAGVPYVAPPPQMDNSPVPAPPQETVIQPTIEIAPGITIPIGPPTTVPVGPPAPQQQPQAPPPAAPPPPPAGAEPPPQGAEQQSPIP